MARALARGLGRVVTAPTPVAGTCSALLISSFRAVTLLRTSVTPISDRTVACIRPPAHRSGRAGSYSNSAGPNDTAVSPISRSANARSIPTTARYAPADACYTTTVPRTHPTDARFDRSGANSPVTTAFSGPTSDRYTHVGRPSGTVGRCAA